MSETVRHLNEARHAALIDGIARTQRRTGRSTFPQRETAEAVLYQEARLLDQGRYEEWLELYTDDCMYWVPAEHPPGDPRREASVNFDDRRRLLDRVALIRSGYLHAQTPPSRTCRTIGNVETWETPDGTLEVRSSLTLWAWRRGETVPYAGAQEHELVQVGDSWRIRQKTIRLINCDAPLGNMTFIL